MKDKEAKDVGQIGIILFWFQLYFHEEACVTGSVLVSKQKRPCVVQHSKIHPYKQSALDFITEPTGMKNHTEMH